MKRAALLVIGLLVVGILACNGAPEADQPAPSPEAPATAIPPPSPTPEPTPTMAQPTPTVVIIPLEDVQFAECLLSDVGPALEWYNATTIYFSRAMATGDWNAGCTILPAWVDAIDAMESAFAGCPTPRDLFLCDSKEKMSEAVEELIAASDLMSQSCGTSETALQVIYETRALGHLDGANELIGAATDALGNYSVE